MRTERMKDGYNAAGTLGMEGPRDMTAVKVLVWGE